MIKLQDFAPVIEGSPLYQGITLQICPGEILPILGASGCGKTSLLNALRGDIPHVGSVSVVQSDIFSVFQHHDQLFPWFTNQRNLELACNQPYWAKAQQWQVDQQLTKYPGQISVGQRQRLVLLRGACSGRPVLLCDEPLSAVDDITSINIVKDFRDLIHKSRITCIWITHNIIEAKLLSDQSLVIQNNMCRLTKGSNLEDAFCISF